MLGFAGTRQWVYQQHIEGRFQRLRRWTFTALHLLLFATPWITVGGNPALRFDLPERRLYLLGSIFTARDTLLLLLLLLFLAFSLFFFTALFGRIWCGFACPQTAFLDYWIRPIERWIEGDRNVRMRRDAGGWTVDRAWRKVAKQALFVGASLVVAMAFMSYFAGAVPLWTGRASGSEYALVAFFGGLMYLDAAWFREQFCNFLCPYARFQSALTDQHSLIIAYDPVRGEPRGGRTSKLEGRCVDCKKCVVVCPQGIDIRNGFQLECIACAKCVDACQSVMEVLGHETLVRYSTFAREEARARRPLPVLDAPAKAPVPAAASARARRIRPRTVVYAGLLSALAASMAFVAIDRTPIEASVQRAPGSLFTLDGDGFVRNTYLLRVTNNRPSTAATPFHVHVDGLPGAEVICEGVTLATSESRTLPLVIRVPERAALARTIPIHVRVMTPQDSVEVDATFKTDGPSASLPRSSDD